LDPQQGVQARLDQQGEVGIRTQSTVSDEHVPGLQGGMHLAHAGQIVRVQRCHNELAEEAWASMKQGEQMGNRKATTWLLFRWLPELLL
jgi:hypothetical protein